MPYEKQIASELGVEPAAIAATIRLLDEGNTIPFLARYRKEATSGLDEEQLRAVQERLANLRALDERRERILAGIAEQGKLTPELERAVRVAETLSALEDLYLPYRPKRRTRASIARERGLEPLADLILQQPVVRQSLEEIARRFVTEDVPAAEDALAGARDIVAETISDHAAVRGEVREKALQWAVMRSERVDGSDDPKATYQLYYAFESRIDRLQPYQVLAVNRGEAEKVLRVRVEISERDWLVTVRRYFRPERRSPFAGQLQSAIEDAAKRLLLPAIERDVRRALTERAESHAINVFAENLRGLLSQPPLVGHVLLGVDPGFRTGCKVAVVDPTGKLLSTATIYPHTGSTRKDDARDTLTRLVRQHGVTLVAIGNGTASRETEQFVAAWIKNAPAGSSRPHYLIVSEAGASVYSASPLARSELPELDVTLRGAVSIARRVQDPLAELVKIDPKSIGVGLYQHDVDQKALEAALDGVVETVVNRVGVDVNTASPALLTHVAGIGPTLAERIVEYRDRHGPFRERTEVRNVKGLGPKAFEQAAGFLRIYAGPEPLDGSAIHPESYRVAKSILKKAGTDMNAAPEARAAAVERLQQRHPLPALAAEAGTGVPTLTDILEQIVRPGRDPRADAPQPILRSDVLQMEDLRTGMQLKGTVRNVVDFGAFVDIGVKQDGLLHRTKIPRGVSLQLGDVVDVEILRIDLERGRIGLGYVEGRDT